MRRALAAVVLAGGQGTRMGGRKALQPWGGATLVARALAQARSYAPIVAVAVRRTDQLEGAVRAELLIDDPAIPGPLAGLASALAFAERAGAAAVLTLPCDTPLLPADLAERLLGGLDARRPVAMAQSCGRWHPTCAIWRAELGDRIGAYVATGRSSLHGFAEFSGRRIVDWGACAPDPFANANTLEDLARLTLAERSHVD
jgi:molybdopterin-guanine dinucleotide biosynthesis protein A